ncbi:hypothetical protein [Sphingomonas sanxanigenens]|uniref:Uncharacterized protein n=1 Tax=Sphingomonas sanxanigenens DSM 19645 = NX02 TaxID=1123269 RepID=W0AHN4_9SPHN|nr:hypothetical protein [Sphingomonas sanxanigenens]AHE56032.1 hypothetical protein NX02_22030 [Sphingomonas sanxanigenens DSM 19645 = NX02]
MTDPQISSRNRVVSASSLIEAAACALSAIKDEDGLTDAELGAVLHRGADQAQRYRTGLAEMGMIAFLRACSAWNGRFAAEIVGKLDLKLSRVGAGSRSARGFASLLARLQVAVNAALENDDEIDGDELRSMLALLDETRSEIEAMQAGSSTLRAVA